MNVFFLKILGIEKKHKDFYIENRIYIKGNLKNLSVWIFSVPFSLKGSSKCTNHVNVHKLYAVQYIIVCSLDYSFQFRIF